MGSPSTGDLERAIRAYSDAYLSGDAATAYRLLSARCRARHSAAELAAVVAQAKDTYGRVAITSIKTEISGDLARASYMYPVPALDQTAEPWVREGGQWREDDC